MERSKRLFYLDGSSVWINDEEASIITGLLLAHKVGDDHHHGFPIIKYMEGDRP